MNTLGDLRYAARVLRKSPGFTLTAALVIAIGIGANGAIFSLVDAVILRPLPYAHPEQLVRLYERPPGNVRNAVSPLNYFDWSQQNRVFASMAAFSGASSTLTRDGATAERIPGQAVTEQFFSLLGVQPLAGRTFDQSDFAPDSGVVVISERLAKSHLGGVEKAVGSVMMLDGRPRTVIGVVPATFQIVMEADHWLPFLLKHSAEQRKIHYLRVLARMKQGVTIDQARSDLSTVAANLATAFPETNKSWSVTIDPLRDSLVVADLRTTTLVLAGAAAFILLMGCANVASLLLARGIGRAREIAVRSALGGSARRIAQQLLTESTLLALVGGSAGIALAWVIVRAAPSFLPPGTMPVGINLQLDWRVMAFASFATLATGILFGLAPAWQAARLSLAGALRAGGRGMTGHASFRTVLAAGEIAVAVILAAGAGLLLRTITSLDHVDPGFHAANVVTMQVSPSGKRYKEEAQVRNLYQRMDREIAAIPGVKSVGLATVLPLDGWEIGQPYSVVGAAPVGASQKESANYQMVTPRYFETLGISLLRGRAFTDQDTTQSPQVCIVNEALVKQSLGGREPIGAHMIVSGMGATGPVNVDREIVGVIKQVNVDGLGAKIPDAEIYVPVTQNAWFWSAIAVRTEGDPLSVVNSVKQAVAGIDKDLPVTRVRTMEEVAAETVAQPRFRAQLVGAFAGLALVLAAVGIFGLLAFSAGQRTREFGIRMALGAQSSDVLALVLRGGLAIVAAGVATGIAGAAALSRYLASLLFGVQPLDPASFGGAAAVLAAVALAACAIPAWRASRVDPAIALHQE